MERTSGEVEDLILDLHRENLSYQRIADRLTELDISTVCHAKWYKATVWQIVQRAKNK
jgi:intein-encoded DNA endonuclease-like protein